MGERERERERGYFIIWFAYMLYVPFLNCE